MASLSKPGTVTDFRLRKSVTVPSLVLAVAIACPALADDWPQLQHDPAHTGYTADQPSPPYRLKWVRDLGEPTQTASQPIVAEGKLFVGTGHGNLTALDRNTGDTLWQFKTGAPIFGSAAYDKGLVYVSSLDRCCYAVRAADGRQVWRFETGEPIWAAPVVADGRVFVAGRDGFVYALAADSGALLWKSDLGSPVLCTPAYADAKLYVGAGDMHVYALKGDTGEPVWKSPKIPGAAMREYWLVASRGTVIATSQPVYACHHIQAMIQTDVMDPYNRAHANDPVLVDQETFPELVKWYEAHPQHKTFHVLDAATGREKFVAPIIGVNGGSCTTPPPAVAPDGCAYAPYANIWLRASGWCFFGRLHLDTGVMEPLIRDRYAPKLAYANEWHWQPKAGTTFTGSSTWNGGFSVSDQSWGVSIGGAIAFPVRDPGHKDTAPAHNALNIATREDSYLVASASERNRLGVHGTFTSAFHNTCSPAAISGNELFHKSARSVIFAFEGMGERN